MKALIIEDSAEVTEAISVCLRVRWPNASLSSVQQGDRGMQSLESESFDVVFLDINLPDVSGFEVLKQIRSFSQVPVIIVSVRDTELDKAMGLELGADDYIVKPFSPLDLIARANAVLRRSQVSAAAQQEPSITHGGFTLYLASHQALYKDERMSLSPIEYRLLYLLMKNAGWTVSTSEIQQQVWGQEQGDTEAVRTYIRRLRNKLKDAPPQIIVTDHGGGYRFALPEE